VAHVLGVQEPLESLRGVQPLQDVALVLGRQLPVDPFHPLLYPSLLIGLLDVHELEAQGLAVGVPKHVQHVAERALSPGPGQVVDEELPVEVPHREAVVGRVQLRVGQDGLRLKRIEVGQQVAPNPVHVDQAKHPRLLLLVDLALVPLELRAAVGRPLHGLVRDRQAGEHALVEPVPASQQVFDPGQELPGLGPLDDPMVVRAGDADDLAHPELGQGLRGRALELAGIVDPSGGHDQALARHQPRDRELCSDGPRVRQGDVGAGEVVRRQLVGPNLADDLLVGGPESGEVQAVRSLDVRDQQGPRAVGPLHVHGQPEVDGLGRGHVRLAFDLHEVPLHGRDRFHGVHDGPPDDVGEADLAPGGCRQEPVDDPAVLLQELGGDEPERGGGGDL
jgi:hypothetical protein